MNPDKTSPIVPPVGGSIDGISPQPQSVPDQTTTPPPFQDISGLPMPPVPQPNPAVTPMQPATPVHQNNPFKQTTLSNNATPIMVQPQVAQAASAAFANPPQKTVQAAPITSEAQATTAMPQAQTAPNIPNKPLLKTPIDTPRPAAKKHSWLRDLLGLAIFVIVVIVGAWLINSLVFRSFSVVGPSMEPTLEGVDHNDRLIVNLLPVTGAHIAGKKYVPPRGTIIVFKNPIFQVGDADEYIVKRVVGLPGERVTVNNCTLLVHNNDHPGGFNPYPDFKNFASNDKQVNTCIDGDGTDVTVPDDAIFVVGDHRVDNYSMDSRNGGGRATLGTIPLDDIVGPVSLRIWPIDQFKLFR